MNRTTVVALAAAAVLGTTGGVTLALSGTDKKEQPGADQSSSSDARPSESSGGDEPAADPTPLYYSDGAIHDGAKNVSVPTEVAAGDVFELARVDGGWLVVQGVSDDNGNSRSIGTFVPESGEAWRIGEWFGSADITAERDRLVYGNGFSWHVATFADRITEPVDILDGLGKEPRFMETGIAVPGIAIVTDGLITGWRSAGTTRLVVTEEDHWTHQDWGPRTVDVPLTSPDGTQAVAAYRNPDYAPDRPVGDCLTGGPADDVAAWWKECGIGAASSEPWSPSGDRLLISGTTGDGPGPSWVRVLDPITGEEHSEFDPGGLLGGAEWGDDTTVFTLTYHDESSGSLIKRCDTVAATCEDVMRVPDNAVLGSR